MVKLCLRSPTAVSSSPRSTPNLKAGWHCRGLPYALMNATEGSSDGPPSRPICTCCIATGAVSRGTFRACAGMLRQRGGLTRKSGRILTGSEAKHSSETAPIEGNPELTWSTQDRPPKPEAASTSQCWGSRNLEAYDQQRGPAAWSSLALPDSSPELPLSGGARRLRGVIRDG